jgi:hypothetical protein
MAESQKHGFVWQADIMEHVYGVPAATIAAENYTAVHDIPAIHNALDHIDLSIKTTGNPQRVDLGSALRVYDTVASGMAYRMTVICWAQEGETKRVTGIVEVDLTCATAELFGTLTRADIAALDAAIRVYPKGLSASAPECEPITALCASLCRRSGAIQLNKKIDSGSQRRLQCSFNRFQDFIAAHPERVIAQSTTCEFRGGRIQECIASGRRMRN